MRRCLTGAFAHVGVVGAGPSVGSGDPDPVGRVVRSLDHPANVLTLKVTGVQEGAALGWETLTRVTPGHTLSRCKPTGCRVRTRSADTHISTRKEFRR